MSGRLETDGKAHTVVLTDDAETRQADYWRKVYATRVGEGGRFEVRVREPARGAGTFRLMFCFDNRAITGDGKTRELKTAFAKTYTPAAGGYRFEP